MFDQREKENILYIFSRCLSNGKYTKMVEIKKLGKDEKERNLNKPGNW